MWWIVLLLSLIALVGVLFWGVVTMGIGGEYNSKSVSYTHLTLPTNREV